MYKKLIVAIMLFAVVFATTVSAEVQEEYPNRVVINYSTITDGEFTVRGDFEQTQQNTNEITTITGPVEIVQKEKETTVLVKTDITRDKKVLKFSQPARIDFIEFRGQNIVWAANDVRSVTFFIVDENQLGIDVNFASGNIREIRINTQEPIKNVKVSVKYVPGFEAIGGIIGLSAVYLRRKISVK